MRLIYRIHLHCYNGGMKEKDAWMQHYPNTVFGFTGMLLRGDRHLELDKVVKSLLSTKILTLHIFYHPYSVNIGTIHHMALIYLGFYVAFNTV